MERSASVTRITLARAAMNELFIENEAFLCKLFTYMCSQSTAIEDPISNTAAVMLRSKLLIAIGVAGISFFENTIIFPYFHMTRQQREYLFELASNISKHRHRFCNGCIILTEFSDRTIDPVMVWTVIFQAIASSKKHAKCMPILVSVVTQRIMSNVHHTRHVMDKVHNLAAQMFNIKRHQAIEEATTYDACATEDTICHIEWLPASDDATQLPISPP